MHEIEDAREAIDKIDRRIVELLNDRYAEVAKIGRAKKALGLPIRVPERETALLEKLQELNRGGILPQTALLNIYRAVIDGAVALEETETE